LAETFEEYKKRVLGLLGGRDPMRVLSTTPRRLELLLKGRSRRILTRHPAVGKWSIIEIMAHLSDAELALGWRFRNMMATPGVQLQWWDEHLWSEKCDYVHVPLKKSMATFRVLREANLALLRTAGTGAWESSYGIHEKRGQTNIAELVIMEAAHDLNHLLQMKHLISLK
jgi:hypothetical protein